MGLKNGLYIFLIRQFFRNIPKELEEAAYTYEQKIYASDIDYNRHVNNIHYVRYMLNALQCSFWEKARIREGESTSGCLHPFSGRDDSSHHQPVQN